MKNTRQRRRSTKKRRHKRSQKKKTKNILTGGVLTRSEQRVEDIMNSPVDDNGNPNGPDGNPLTGIKLRLWNKMTGIEKRMEARDIVIDSIVQDGIPAPPRDLPLIMNSPQGPDGKPRAATL